MISTCKLDYQCVHEKLQREHRREKMLGKYEEVSHGTNFEDDANQ